MLQISKIYSPEFSDEEIEAQRKKGQVFKVTHYVVAAKNQNCDLFTSALLVPKVSGLWMYRLLYGFQTVYLQ